MLKKKRAPDRAVLVRKLHYSPETGEFTWVERGGGKANPGARAGCKTKAHYRILSVGNVLYMEHRLAWLYAYGEWPDDDIDHINGVRDDNRLCNLRRADRSSNMENIRVARRDNRTGLLGARLRPDGKFFACIKTRGLHRHLGSFDTAEEAHNAYIAAKRIHHRGNTL